MKKYLIFILVLFMYNIINVVASPQLPTRTFKITKEYPTQCEIYIGSNGEFYYAFDGYEKTIFGEKTAEDSVKAAQDRLDYWKETDSRTYRLVFAQGLN